MSAAVDESNFWVLVPRRDDRRPVCTYGPDDSPHDAPAVVTREDQHAALSGETASWDGEAYCRDHAIESGVPVLCPDCGELFPVPADGPLTHGCAGGGA